MAIIAIKIEYDGTNYSGWQIQANTKTIQGLLESALFSLVGYPIGIIGSGRTDSGVHAAGQVASFSIDGNFPIPIDKIQKAINSRIPRDIRVLEAREVDDDFNARFSAISREYIYQFSSKYTVFNRQFKAFIDFPFDFDLLCEIAAEFVGTFDFTAFSKRNPSTKSYICTVEQCDWKRENEFDYQLKIKANRFVYGMVRSLVGTMLDVAYGKRTIEEVRQKLHNQSRDIFSPLAPPEGLILNKIYYPE